MATVTFRKAKKCDAALVQGFIRDLAEYEHLLDDVVADAETIAEQVFDKHGAEVIFPMVGDEEIGFALYFFNFSTFLGRSGLYIEDLFIKPEHRGRGYGKATLAHLARIALERGCGRMEWWCLDWNRPSIDFYLSLGAESMDEWTVYRLSGDTLNTLAQEAE
jgi:GNAT superfamily N-acetyltransferase